MTAAVRDRQMSYLADSRPVTQETVLNWSWRTRLWNNALAVVGPNSMTRTIETGLADRSVNMDLFARALLTLFDEALQ